MCAPSPGGRAAGADVEQVAPDVALGLIRVVVSDAEHAAYLSMRQATRGVVVLQYGAAKSAMEDGRWEA